MESISQQKWSKYLKELFQWITEKYELMTSNEITEQEYNEHLEYYESEKLRIENLLSDIQEPKVEVNKVSSETPIEELEEKNDNNNKKILSQFSQATFEDFFGVKLDNSAIVTGGNVKQKKGPKLDKPAIPQPARKPEEISQPEQSTEPPVKPPVKQSVKPPVKPPVEETKEIDTVIDDTNSHIWEYMEPPTKKGVSQTPPGDGQTISANIILIGDSTSGRTSLRRSWTGKHFISNHLTTIGASLEKKSIVLDEWKFDITLTDLGGQDFYSDLRKNFYRNIDAAVIVFDLTSKDSFRRIDYWVKEFYREGRKLVPFILVGNKCDLSNRIIPANLGRDLALKYSSYTLPKFKVRYIEASAKTGKNVNQIFEVICREVRSFKIQNRRKKSS